MAGPGRNSRMDLRSADQRRLRQSPTESPERHTAQTKGKRARATTNEQTTVSKRTKTSDLQKAFKTVEEKMHYKWEELGNRLDLAYNYIQGIRLKHREDPAKCCRAMLEQWRGANGKDATLEMLCKAIRECNCVHVAEQIEGADGDLRYSGQPDAPEDVEVVKTTESWIKIKWAPPATCEDGLMMGYMVEYSVAGSRVWTIAHEQHCLSNDTREFEVGHLTKNKQYHFRVSTVNRNGAKSEPAYSAWGIAKTQGKPGTPRNLRVIDVDRVEGTVSLEWLKPEDNGGYRISSYIVEKSYRRPWEVWDTCIQVSGQQCRVKQIRPIEGHRFRVSARNSKGYQSDPSDMVDPELRVRVDVAGAHHNREAAQDALWEGAFGNQGLKGKTVEKGSIIYVYSCKDIGGLREVWDMYCRGEVRQYFQKLLVTEQVLRACGASKVELEVTIDPKDVRSCCIHLLLTRPSPHGYRVLKTPTDDDFALMKEIDATITDSSSVIALGELRRKRRPSATGSLGLETCTTFSSKLAGAALMFGMHHYSTTRASKTEIGD
ncbi:titin-like [Branchiostoma floridae]|uniref:Titin-like n=1 Tax=Branchiostoma floridae TaxID=7739 RepID=A0A9J7LW68_BRAFL|nr:titin-like [Branchiostoma floridae]